MTNTRIGVARGVPGGLPPEGSGKKCAQPLKLCNRTNIYVKVCCLLIIVDVNLTKICSRNVKNDRFCGYQVCFSSSKYTKTRFLPGLRPGPRWGSLRRSPRPPSRLGRGPSLFPSPLDAFGVSISAPSAPRVSGPPTQIPGYADDEWVVNHLCMLVTCFLSILLCVVACDRCYLC